MGLLCSCPDHCTTSDCGTTITSLGTKSLERNVSPAFRKWPVALQAPAGETTSADTAEDHNATVTRARHAVASAAAPNRRIRPPPTTWLRTENDTGTHPGP